MFKYNIGYKFRCHNQLYEVVGRDKDLFDNNVYRVKNSNGSVLYLIDEPVIYFGGRPVSDLELFLEELVKCNLK